MFSRSMSSTCRQRRLPCQCFPPLGRSLSRLLRVVRPSPSDIKWVLKTSQKFQVTSFCRVFLINALLLPSPRPFDIGASKRAIGLQEYLNIFVASLKCKKKKNPKLTISCIVAQTPCWGGGRTGKSSPSQPADPEKQALQASPSKKWEIYLDHVAKLVDFVIWTEPLPPVCCPLAHYVRYVFGSIVLLSHI